MQGERLMGCVWSACAAGQKDRLVKEEENVLPDVFAAGFGKLIMMKRALCSRKAL